MVYELKGVVLVLSMSLNACFDLYYRMLVGNQHVRCDRELGGGGGGRDVLERPDTVGGGGVPPAMEPPPILSSPSNV